MYESSFFFCIFKFYLLLIEDIFCRIHSFFKKKWLYSCTLWWLVKDRNLYEHFIRSWTVCDIFHYLSCVRIEIVDRACNVVYYPLDGCG